MPKPNTRPQHDPADDQPKRRIDLPGDERAKKEAPPAKPVPRPSDDRRAGSAHRRKERS